MANIYVAGHKGMVGSAISRELKLDPLVKLITADRKNLDLLNQNQVKTFFKDNKIDQVYLAAAKVGGIHANNSFPAEFIYKNLMIQNNIINSAYESNIKRLMFLGSSCIFPKSAEQPLKEEALLSGYLEPTNEAYAIAKIAGIKMCEFYSRQYGVDYRSVMPTNLYGYGDNYHSDHSHVLPALIQKFHSAKVENKKYVTLWGTGAPLREFLFSDDLARACIHINNLSKKSYIRLTKGKCSFINIGSGEEISISELALLIKKVVGFNGNIKWDSSKPDGTLRKFMDSSRLKSTGWEPSIPLEKGISISYLDYLESKKNGCIRIK